MKMMRRIALFLGISACAAVSVCLLTDWKDDLFLPLGLFLSAASNLLNVMVTRREKGGKEKEQ
ncbi:MAG: hypothetical protein ACI3XY_07725 [Butyricicoccaceae bacterium]